MHITKTTKLKVIELHQEGYSIHKISRELSIARSKASLIINNYAIYGENSLKRNLKNRKYTAEEKLQIINEYLAGSTMSSLALKYGIPSGTGLISTWERGEREPLAHQLIVLAAFFNCSVDYLLGISDSK